MENFRILRKKKYISSHGNYLKKKIVVNFTQDLSVIGDSEHFLFYETFQTNLNVFWEIFTKTQEKNFFRKRILSV